MKIGFGRIKKNIVCVEVDLKRPCELYTSTVGSKNLLIPAKQSISCIDSEYYIDLERRKDLYVYVHDWEECWVKWNGKYYKLDSSPEKYEVLKNIIMTDIALEQLK